MTVRVPLYLPQTTLATIDAIRPEGHSRSQFIAMLAQLGAEHYQAMRPATTAKVAAV